MPFTFRPLDPGELGTFCDGAEEAAALRAQLTRSLERGSARPGWCWIAVNENGQTLARHFWWGPPGSDRPIVLRSVSAEDLDVAAALVILARKEIGVEEAWCEATVPIEAGRHPSEARADLVGLVTSAGFAFAVGRVSVKWTPDTGVRPPSGALALRPAHEFGEDALAELFRAVGDGSVDHGMVTGRRRLGPDAEARRRLAFVRTFRGEPDWFTVGVTETGDLAGYVVPAVAGPDGVIAELGVAAAHRGRGYAGALLAHATSVLAPTGVEGIYADTDLANTHMRSAFARAGYREFAWRDDYGWHKPDPGESPGRQTSTAPCALETARLLLAPLVPGDAAEMAGVLADPALYEFIGGAPPTVAELERLYQRQAAGRSDDGAEVWHNWIIRPAGGPAVGYAQASIARGGEWAEVAWVLGAPHQRHGYGSETASAVVAWLGRAGAREVAAHIHPGNAASQIVARRAGLTPTTVVKDGEVRWQRVFRPER